MNDIAETIVPARDTVSLIRGGLFYEAQLRTHLIAPQKWNLGRRLIFAIAIGRLTLALITLCYSHTLWSIYSPTTKSHPECSSLSQSFCSDKS